MIVSGTITQQPMCYTIIGGFIGFFLSYWIAITTGMDMSSGYAPSAGGLFVCAGTILGLGIGFGVGATRFANGTYVPQFKKRRQEFDFDTLPPDVAR